MARCRLNMAVAAVAGATWLAGLPGAQAGTAVPEYQLKAAMLYKFALFVEWPPAATATNVQPFVIGVLGEDPFGPWLEHEVDGLSVGSHPVAIRRLQRAEDARACQAVFVSRSEARGLPRILGALGDASVLTVSDIDAFCEHGGMIGFVTVGNAVRFEVSPDTAERVGLRINAQLQRVALTVHRAGPGKEP